MRLCFFLKMLVFIFLISCGKGNNGKIEGTFSKNSGNPTTREIYTETDPDKRLREVIDWYHVSCEKPMECPGYMAMLVIEDKVDFGFSQYRCSSFLIGDDVLATNAHCIPDDLKEGDSCVDRIYALFPKSKSKGEKRIGCEKVLSKIKDKDLGYDYSFIKLSEKPDREVPEMDHGERLNGMDVTIWKVDPRESYFGLIRKNNCKLLNDSLLTYSRFSPPFSPNFGYSGCENLHGNSGSPLLNGDGKIIGISQSVYTNFAPEDEFFKDFIPDGYLELLSFGTNFGCLCKKGEAYTYECGNTPESCRKKRSQREIDEQFDFQMREKAKIFLSFESKNNFQDIFGELKGNSLEWKIGFSHRYKIESGIYKAHKVFANLIPKCIKNYEALVTESSELLVDGISNRFLLFPGAIICEIDASFNSKLQMVGMKLNPQKCFNSDFHLSFLDSGSAIEVSKDPSLNITWEPDGMAEGHDYPYSREIILGRCETLGEGAGSVVGLE
jgi:hypothetical protein